MKQTKRSYLRMGGLVLVLLLSMSALVTMAGASPTAAPARAPLYAPLAAIDNEATSCAATTSPDPVGISCQLYATTGMITMPDGTTMVPIWGYSDTAGGDAQLPGPTIVATEGDTVNITLHNKLTQPTALIFPGQAMIPDLEGVAAFDGATIHSKTYTFVASNPGTYLYESGLLPDAARQVAMGMVGALVVRPSLGADLAYGASSDFDVEALLLLSEIDPALNANPALFDMRDYSPKYRLINGKAYPDTEDIVTGPGYRVLLRYVNAGIQQHTMGVLGMDQEVIARDANLRPYPQRQLAESIGPGRTADAIVTVPASAGSVGNAGETHFPLYDTSLLLHNNGAGFGGMLAFLTVPDGTTPYTGPTTTEVDLDPNPTDESLPVDITATIMAGATLDVTAAEYFVDAIGTDDGGCPMTIASVAAMVSASAVIPTSGATGDCAGFDLDTLVTGDHTVYVHGYDGTNWGEFNVVVLHLDKLGPVTSGITLFPNPNGGDVNIDVSATGNDTTTGKSNIIEAEYFIDEFPDDTVRGTPMAVNVEEPIASLDETIDATSLADGIRTVYVRSLDSLGHWGAFATAELKLDRPSGWKLPWRMC
jgi:FtsP/CotA-like multicopper oxidase with cupredoxin domain